MELWDRAQKLHLEGNFAEAEVLYDTLLTQNHDHAGLLATMGTIYLHLNKIGLAMALLHKSVDSLERRKMPVPSDVLSNLGMAYKYAGRREQAMKYMKRAASGDTTPGSLVAYGSMFVESGDTKQAISLNKRALTLEPEMALAHWNMSLAMLEDGQWGEAWEHYDYGLGQTGVRLDRKIGDVPIWDGTPGKTVVVYGEQGLGDEIMFASMLPDLMKTNTVIVECHQRLKHLLEHSFPGLKCYGTREDTELTWPQNEKFDYRISIGSLGKFYRRSSESFPGTPYLSAESAPRGDKFRIGISWTGGQKAGRIQKRTVPLSWWKNILDSEHDGVEFVSLQYTDCGTEIDEVNKLGYNIKQFPEIKAHDYYETAKLVKSCDLVITVCTSVVHLAGALGVPCWVMTPKHPAWRYQNKGRMPWYRSVRLYRQMDVPGSKIVDAGSWIPVIEKVASDLSDMIVEQREAA